MVNMTYKILSDEILAIKLLIVEDYKNKELTYILRSITKEFIKDFYK